MHKDVAGIALERSKIVQVPGIGERVEIDHRMPAAHGVEDEVGADETRASGDQ